MKAFAEDNLNVVKKMIYVLVIAENNVRKGENAGHQNFLLFRQCVQKPSCPRSLKLEIVWYRINEPTFRAIQRIRHNTVACDLDI